MKTSDQTWEKDASCRKILDWILDEYTPEDYAERKQVCMGCPVIEQCREWVDSFEKNSIRHQYDVYGGEEPEERVARRVAFTYVPDPCTLARPRTVAAHRNRNERLCSKCEAYLERKAANEKRWNYARDLILKGYCDHEVTVLAQVSRDKVYSLRRELEFDSVSS